MHRSLGLNDPEPIHKAILEGGKDKISLARLHLPVAKAKTSVRFLSALGFLVSLDGNEHGIPIIPTDYP
jgi:hypothetical protein